MSLSILYVPCDCYETAKNISIALLEKKLIACSNIIPNISSLYLAQEDDIIIQDEEYVMILKTDSKLVSKCEKVIKENHNYKTPAIINIPASSNKEFSSWLKTNVTKAS